MTFAKHKPLEDWHFLQVTRREPGHIGIADDEYLVPVLRGLLVRERPAVLVECHRGSLATPLDLLLGS